MTLIINAPIQNNGLSRIWRDSVSKSVNVNAVENGSQSFRKVKDIR